jgi:hypothetical protein
MAAGETRFEVRVGTLLSQATVAAFRLPLSRIDVPHSTLHRLRIPADRDVPEVLHQLIERDVQVVEIRQCAVHDRREEPRAEQADPDETAPDETADDVVLPFRRPGAGQRAAARRRCRK